MSRFQYTLDQAYLKGFGRNLRPRTPFSHQRMMCEISQFRPKSPSEAKLPYQPKMSKKKRFSMIFQTSSKVLDDVLDIKTH